MAKDDFQANWRGARRFQFDEETRRKQEAYSEWHASPASVGPWNASQASERISQLHPKRTVRPDEIKSPAEVLRPKRRVSYLAVVATAVFLAAFLVT
ncbi:hypothetical protein [Mesorhizobium sp. Root552]|uniref:hypothetical protein n=1 Tax=Mesorhizobium sp. Root552 TaxID=1736555 RepID=UPI0012E89DA5|nr:hypothetical protein [Mesorhizobium sp. Root552]